MFTQITPQSTDLNTWTDPGMYYVGGGYPNSTGDWSVVVVFHVDNYVVQLTINAITANMSVRARTETGDWCSWKSIV